MVARIVGLQLYVFLAVTSAVAAPELIPHASVRELEGVKFPELTFRDGKRLVTYEPPAGWSCNGGASKLLLRDAKAFQVQGTLEVASINSPVTSDEVRSKMVREAAVAGLPEGADHIEVTSENPATIYIDGKKTASVTVSYNIRGAAWSSTFYVVDLADSKLEARISAPQPAFANALAMFQKSLCSLQWRDQ